MICSKCGSENEKGFKFCVKCGSSLTDPNEVNYEQVDMGGYHSEEEYSAQRSGFSIGNGTFTINDRSSQPAESALYTADELNDTNEEFDFSMYDDAPQEQAQTVPQPVMGGMNPQQPPVMAAPPQMMGGMAAMPGMPGMGGMPQFMGGQPMMMPQPQIIGYDQNGMPVYSQAPPIMMPQPQIIGYDQNGMPVYGQAAPMMMPQPQIIGYDQNGMPVYGQAAPIMMPQPQIIGYDQNGMPVYGQPAVQDPSAMYGAPMQNPVFAQMQTQPAPQPEPEPEPPVEEAHEEESFDEFWSFFGSSGETQPFQPEENDFFSKASRQASVPSPSDPDSFFEKPKPKKREPDPYMNDLPVVDGSALSKRDTYKAHRNYMKETESVNADDLIAKAAPKSHVDKMVVAESVNADMLEANVKKKSKYTMQSAGEADPDSIETYVRKHSESMMAQADHAVEAMPKKKNPYESELDKIELPEHMKAKKTKREDSVEIPSIPQVGVK